MMQSDPEFLMALHRAQENHDHVCPDMARQVIEMLRRVLDENRAQCVSEPFGESLRKALNRRDIIANRSAYKAVVGFYFGQRGNRVVRANSAKGRYKLPVRTKPEHGTDENGQMYLVL